MKFIPSLPEVGREAVIVLAGAILAAAVMSQFPSLKTWIKAQWQ
jgi:hypothetical protein